MNAYKVALIKAAHGTLDALTHIVEITTPENQASLAAVTTSMIVATSDLLDLIQAAPEKPPPPPPPPTPARNR